MKRRILSYIKRVIITRVIITYMMQDCKSLFIIIRAYDVCRTYDISRVITTLIALSNQTHGLILPRDAFPLAPHSLVKLECCQNENHPTLHLLIGCSLKISRYYYSWFIVIMRPKNTPRQSYIIRSQVKSNVSTEITMHCSWSVLFYLFFQ